MIRIISYKQDREYLNFILALTMCCFLPQGGTPAIAAGSAATNSSKESSAQKPLSTSSNAKSSETNAEWNLLFQSAAGAVLTGNFGDAEDKYKLALNSAVKIHDEKAEFSCTSGLANCLSQEAGKLAEEGALRQKCLDSAEKIYGKTSPRYASAMASLAGWYARNGEVEKARESSELATKLLGNAEDKYPLEMAECFEAVGMRLIAQGTFGLADDAYKKALDLRQSKLPDSDPLMLELCKRYADLLTQLGNKSEASKLTQRITLVRATGAVVASGSNANSGSPNATKSSGKLSLYDKLMQDATTAAKAGDKEAAINNAKLAAAEAEKSGAKDGRLPYALVHLGDYYAVKGQSDEAQAVYKKAFDLREAWGADKTLGMARNLERLASAALRSKSGSGSGSEAERLLTKALNIEDQLSAPNSMIAINLQYQLSACMLNKDYSAAETASKRLSQISEKLTEPMASMKKRMAIAMLGSVYIQSGRQSEGLQILKTMGSAPAPSQADSSKSYMDEYTTTEKLVDDSEIAGFGR